MGLPSPMSSAFSTSSRYVFLLLRMISLAYCFPYFSTSTFFMELSNIR